jgi:hypothetical protein
MDGILFSDTEDPIDPAYGGFEYSIYIQGKAGTLVDFYLHINNRHDVGIDYSIMAFLDYVQQPIVCQGNPYAPLYVHAKAGAWEIIQVQFMAPQTPGHYDFQLVGVVLPFTSMDAATQKYITKYIDYPLPVYFSSSTRVYLDVIP